MSDGDEFTAAVLYRLAYGLAADLVEIRRSDHAWGRAFASGVGDDSHALVAEVLKPTGTEGQGAAAAVVRETVEDVREGRWPRW